MKKRFLTLALVLALCLSLAVPALAAAGDTTVVDANGVTYQLSQPILRVESMPEDVKTPAETVYIVSEGTKIVPLSGPEGYAAGRDAEDQFIVFEKTENDSITIWTETLYQGLGGSDQNGITIGAYESDKYTKYHGFMSQRWLDGSATEVHTIFACAEPENGPAEPTTPKFTDVKDSDWFAKPVARAVEQKITTGTTATTFSPYQDCTVAQILTFLWRANGSPTDPAMQDVIDEGVYYAGAVDWAINQGIVPDTVDPSVPCTRAMAVEYIWKAAGSPKADAANFEDVPADATYADAVAWAVKAGVTTGTSETTFDPDTVCNRGHIVTFLYRAFAA